MEAHTATPVEIEEMAERYGEAWNTQDVDAIVGMHAGDGIFQLHIPGGEPVEGRDAIREAFAGFIAQLPDIHFETVRLSAGADHWVLESRLTGTVAAPIEVDGEQREAAGARVDVDFVDHITVRDGLIERKDSYLDGLAFERQMGAGG